MTFPMYDPADLSKEQILELLGIDEQHRIVLIGDGKAIIVDLDEMEKISRAALSITAENLFRNPMPPSPYLDSFSAGWNAAAKPLTEKELRRQLQRILDIGYGA